MALTKIHLGNIKGPQGSQGSVGPQGEPFRYEDFTEEQLNELAQRTAVVALEAANICYVSSAIPTADKGNDGDICVVKG